MERQLSELLKLWRAERPDEWIMDEFIREAERLEKQLAGILLDSDQTIIANHYDKTVKDALIALGWTPPEEKTVSSNEMQKDRAIKKLWEDEGKRFRRNFYSL